MPWFNVDDGFTFHVKCVKAGNAAVGLWTRAGAWSARHLTDGFIPKEIVATIGTPAQAARLVSSGLWAEADGGYLFHEWSEENRNPTREKVLEKRRNEAERKAKQRERKSASSQVADDCPAGTDTDVPAGVPGGVRDSPPLPSPKEQKKTPSSSPRKRGTRIPDDFSVTPDMVVWARQRVPHVDGRHETEKFINFWTAKSGRDAVKLDWVRTWQNWMLTAAERASSRASPTNGYRSQTDANIAAFLGGDQPPHLLALPGGAS